MCILDQSAVHGSAAECTRIRCSAQKTEDTTGIRRRLSINVAMDHKLSGLRAKVENFCRILQQYPDGTVDFCAQTGKYVVAGYVQAQSPSDSGGVLSFLSRAADPGAEISSDYGKRYTQLAMWSSTR